MQIPRHIIVIAGTVLLVLVTSVVVGVLMSQDGKVADVPEGVTHEVHLTENGYEPKELTIALYDTVAFSSDRGFPHWPASNFHPAHNQYPAFDPRTPVPSDETWSFQFTQTGVWEFHDHLNSTHQGTITVTTP